MLHLLSFIFICIHVSSNFVLVLKTSDPCSPLYFKLESTSHSDQCWQYGESSCCIWISFWVVTKKIHSFHHIAKCVLFSPETMYIFLQSLCRPWLTPFRAKMLFLCTVTPAGAGGGWASDGEALLWGDGEGARLVVPSVQWTLVVGMGSLSCPQGVQCHWCLYNCLPSLSETVQCSGD